MEYLKAALTDPHHHFTAAELQAIIDRQFTDDTLVLDSELVDMAVERLLILELGTAPSQEQRQAKFEEVAYRYLRQSLGLPET